MELEVTWGHAVRVWWAYLWRNLLMIVAVLVLGTALGFVVGFVMGLLGIPTKVIVVFTGVVSGILGLALSVVPIKLLLGKDFGSFRLVLVSGKPKDEGWPATRP